MNKTIFVIFILILFIPIFSVAYQESVNITEDFSNAEYFNKQNTLFTNYGLPYAYTSSDCITPSSEYIDTICFSYYKWSASPTVYNWSMEISDGNFFKSTILGGGNEVDPVIVVTFKDSITVQNTSILEIVANNTQGQTNTFEYIAAFLKNDYSDNCSIAYYPNYAGMPFAYTNEICDYVIGSTVAEYPEKKSFEVNTTTKTTFSLLMNHTVNNIDRLVIVADWGGGSFADTLNIYSFSILNALNGTNALPEFNLSTSSIGCFNLSENLEVTSPAVFNLSISAFDEENDTLYYASSFSPTNITYKTSFNKFSSPLGLGSVCVHESNYCTPTPDFSFVSNSPYPTGNECNINQRFFLTVYLYNSSDFNLVSSESYDSLLGNIHNVLGTTLYEDVYQLELNGGCTGTPYFYFESPKSLIDIFYSATINGFNSGDSFNVSFLDSSLGTVAKAKYVNDVSGRMLIYMANDTSEVLELNTSNSELTDNQSFKLNIQLKNTTTSLTLAKLSAGGNTLATDSNNINNPKFVKYIRYEIENTTSINLEGFSIIAVAPELSFSASPPTNLTFYGDAGSFSYTLFVSDSVNQPYKFTSKTITGSITQCSILPNQADFKGENSDLKYMPNFGNEFLNGLFLFLRLPRRLLESLNLLNMWFLVVNVGLIWGFYKLYKRFEMKHQDNIMEKLFRYEFTVIFILYFVFLLIPESIFVVASIPGLFYIGSEFLKVLKLEGADFNKNLFFGMSFFNILSYLYFSFVQVATNITFVEPVIKFSVQNNSTFLIQLAFDFMNWISTVLLFTIPSVPNYVNILFIMVRVFSIIAFIAFLKNLINPLAQA